MQGFLHAGEYKLDRPNRTMAAKNRLGHGAYEK
jgi:hypothetical protein